MKTIKSLLVLLILVLLGFLMVGCSPASSVEVQGKEKVDVDDGGFAYGQLVEIAHNFLEEREVALLKADELFQKIVMEADPSYFLVDVRSREDFLAASIQGAISIPYELTYKEEILTRLPTDKKIVIVDDDGGLAGQIAASWGMLGYDVGILANGMKSWVNSKPEKCELESYPISTETGTTTSTYGLPEFSWPEGSTLAEILAKQNGVLIQEQNQGQITATTVKEDLDGERNLFLLDVRQSDHYQRGHLPGAINIPLKELGLMDRLSQLPPEQKIVVIDYDGHYGNMAARLLNHLGYEASALAGGMSSWTRDIKVIGQVPNNYAWLTCYELAQDQEQMATTIAQWNWGKLPTVKTELSIAAGAGCS